MILVEPADAQFLVSTAHFQPWRYLRFDATRWPVSVALTLLRARLKASIAKSTSAGG